MAERYVRITQVDGVRYILRVTADTEHRVCGIEVDRNGDEVVPPGFTERMRIVERGAIKKMVEMEMNNVYATLEVVK